MAKGNNEIVLNVSDEFFERLEKLQGNMGMDDAPTVIRHSLQLLEYLIGQFLEGKKFYVQGVTGLVEIELLGPETEVTTDP